MRGFFSSPTGVFAFLRTQPLLAGVIFFWLLVPMVDSVGILFLDRSFFAYREWEMVRGGPGPGPFVPGVHFSGIIHGDLANMLGVGKFRQPRFQRFTADRFGYRNPEAPENAVWPVVVTGDSDMAGSSQDDDATFSVRLAAILGQGVYNHAPGSPLFVLADERFAARPPRVLVWEAVGRTIHGPAYAPYAALPPKGVIRVKKRSASARSPAALAQPRLSRHFSLRLKSEFLWYAAGLRNDEIAGIDEKTGTLFYAPALAMLGRDNRERGLETVVAGIVRVNELCRRRGVTLIYLPLPDKEDVYRHLLPEALSAGLTPELFLPALHKELAARGVLSVDLHGLYTAAGSSPPLYFPDDTHWNAAGVLMAARRTAALIKDRGLLLP